LNFDFIGHYETLYDDADYVVGRIGINATGTLFDPQRRRPEKLNEWQDRVRQAYASVPEDIRTKLKLLYRFDFEAFEYDPNII
jgi:Sulfotransferase family